jgi:hypothetical protein
MRYTCLKTIVTKVCDKKLEDEEDIQRVLSLLHEKQITCTLQVKGEPAHESVRILEVTEDRITWRMVQSGGTLKKTSKISDIVAITVDSDEAAVTLKPDPSRWSTLDASEI